MSTYWCAHACRSSGAADGGGPWKQQIQASGLYSPQSPGIREEVCLSEDVDEGEQNWENLPSEQGEQHPKAAPAGMAERVSQASAPPAQGKYISRTGLQKLKMFYQPAGLVNVKIHWFEGIIMSLNYFPSKFHEENIFISLFWSCFHSCSQVKMVMTLCCRQLCTYNFLSDDRWSERWINSKKMSWQRANLWLACWAGVFFLLVLDNWLSGFLYLWGSHFSFLFFFKSASEMRRLFLLLFLLDFLEVQWDHQSHFWAELTQNQYLKVTKPKCVFIDIISQIF